MKQYTIHDNGGRPFLVKIDENNVYIYRNVTDWDKVVGNKWIDVYSKKPILTIAYQKIFIGKSPKNQMTCFSGGHGSKFDGNTILVQGRKGAYIFIGETIFKFMPSDEIVKYVSPVGNNDVPYPYAVGRENSYLMLEKKSIPNNKLTMDDPYDQLYGWTIGKQDKKNFSPFTTKQLYHRIAMED